MSTSAMQKVGAAARGVRLALPLQVGARVDEVLLEAAHCEWLVRTAAYAAVRDGLFGMPEAGLAWVLPGTVRAWHDDVRCLESIVLDLRDERGRQVSRMELGREVFDPFVAARAVHLMTATREDVATGRFAYSLHATDGDDEPFPFSVPALPHLSIDALARASVVEGAPGRTWVATFVHPDVVDGFAHLEAASRRSGLEAAGRIHARVGFDPRHRAFVRVLERLVVTRDTVATGATVVSTPGSWGEFLATVPADGPTAPSHVHTHVHLAAGADDGAGEGSLGTRAEPLISVADRVMHLTTFTDPLAAAIVVSVYPDRRVVKLYGYTPLGTLDEEPGYWLLPRARATRKETT